MLAHPCVVTRGRVHSLFLCVLSLLSGASIFSLSTPLLAQATTPTVTLAVKSANNNVTTVPMGRVVTLTALVLSTNPVVGQVLFCEATAAFCQNAAVAVVQALPSGQASFSFVPGPGVHSYKAVLVASDRYFRSESSAQPLSVTASLATTTALTTSGVAGSYVLNTTTSISGGARPAGNMVFVDTTNNNATVGSANVAASAASAALSVVGTPAVGNESFNVQTADFNNDGYADFAVLNTSFLTNLASDQNIMIFLGKGDGSFIRSTVSNVAANWISVGDFNNDGRIDIVASGASSLIILLGNGDGTFNASTMPIGANANESIVADFNRDGNLDLAVFNDTGLSVLLGNGNGTFTAKSTVAFPAGSYASAGVAGDFNGDGLLDIFSQTYVSSGNSVAYLLLGANNGTFVTTAVPFSSANVTALYQQVGDFNGDGKLDVVVNDSQSGSPALRVLFGNNDGTFSVSGATALPSNASLSGGYIQNIAVSDIDGDGKSDVLYIDSKASRVLLSVGDGTFRATSITQGDQSTPDELTMAVADFNGDGLPDIVRVDSDRRDASVTFTSLSRTLTASLSNVALIGNGSHTVRATYSNDAVYAASSATASLTALRATTTLSLVATPTAVISNAQVVLQATLAPYASGSLFTNSQLVTFVSGGVTLGTAPLISGVATLNVTTLPVGVNSITASYAGDANFSASSSAAASVTVTALPTITLSASSLTFATQAAGVASAAQAVTLTNTGSVALSIASITATGDFTRTTTCGSTLAVGANCSISVVFTPTQAGSRTGNLTLIDNALSSPQTITLAGTGAPVTVSASASTLTVLRGATGTSTLQIVGAPGFAGAVTLGCTVTFQGTGTPNAVPTCAMNPAQVTLTSGSTSTSTLTVSTTAGSASLATPLLKGGAEIALAGLLMLWVAPRRRLLSGALLGLLVMTGLAMMTGCGGPSNTATPTPTVGTTSGAYQVSVTATANSVTTTTNVALTVQ